MIIVHLLHRIHVGVRLWLLHGLLHVIRVVLPLICALTRCLAHACVLGFFFLLELLLQLFELVLIDMVLRILAIVDIVFPIKVFINLLLTIYVEHLIFQALHVHSICAEAGTETTRCRLRELMSQRISASWVLWKEFQILVVVGLGEACLRCPIQRRLQWLIGVLFISFIVHICVVALVHDLRHSILLHVDIFNLQTRICHDDEIFNHPSKVVVTHEEVLLRSFLCQLQQKVRIGVHIHHADARLACQKLGGHEDLPLAIVHAEDAEAEAEQYWLAA